MSLPELRLVSHRLCPYVQRARIVLHEKDIPHEIEFIDLADKPAWFVEISPLGKVPLLLVDGRPLFESSVIAEFLDDISPGSLYPDDAFEKAGHRAWVEFASATLAKVASLYRADAQQLDPAIAGLRDHFKRLETRLGDGPWFAGREFAIVDAAFAPVFRYFDVLDRLRDFSLFDGLPRVVAWRSALAARPSVRAAVDEDYAARLQRFFAGLDSEVGRLARERKVA